MNKYEVAVPAHMRELWSAICAAETDAERDGLMRQWDEACRRLSRRPSRWRRGANRAHAAVGRPVRKAGAADDLGRRTDLHGARSYCGHDDRDPGRTLTHPGAKDGALTSDLLT
mgnify:CR=1 FL=1